MPIRKKPIDPSRLRAIPASGFSWIDRRFVREGFLEELSRESALLYFFLAAVSDAKGLSFYSDPMIGRLLDLTPEELSHGRARLVSRGLILYEYPIYQLLPLPSRPATNAADTRGTPRGGEPLSVAELLRRIRDEELERHRDPRSS